MVCPLPLDIVFGICNSGMLNLQERIKSDSHAAISLLPNSTDCLSVNRASAGVSGVFLLSAQQSAAPVRPAAPELRPTRIPRIAVIFHERDRHHGARPPDFGGGRSSSWR